MKGTVRISAKAVVIVGSRILLLKHRDAEGDWHALPGGGQKYGETLPEAIERECLEETGLQVRMGRLLFIRDYIADNHEFASEDGGAHQVELMFECDIVEDGAPRLGARPDRMQTGAEWRELSDLRDLRMYPKAVALILAGGVPEAKGHYLGDVN